MGSEIHRPFQLQLQRPVHISSGSSNALGHRHYQNCITSRPPEILTTFLPTPTRRGALLNRRYSSKAIYPGSPSPYFEVPLDLLQGGFLRSFFVGFLA